MVFKKNEGLSSEKEATTTRLSDKYRSVFSNEESENFIEHTRQMRSEWGM